MACNGIDKLEDSQKKKIFGMIVPNFTENNLNLNSNSSI
jgi:hypothetical protein